MALSPKERRLRARIGAYSQHAKHPTSETTKAARKAFEDRFLDEVDPSRELTEVERLRRAKAAMQAHMARLALKSAQARRRRKAS